MGRELFIKIDHSPAVATADPALESAQALRAKLRVALISVGAALFLTGAKAVVGILTQSLALLSEAAHSALDLFASVVTALSVKAADRPADPTHHYGHGKIESLSALFEATLLLATCGWIIYHAFDRLLGAPHRPVVNAYSFAVILIAIGVDFYRYRALHRTAQRYQSHALEADALHFYSDMISSSMVLLGLIVVALGFPLADAIAALLVAIWVGLLAWRLGRKNADILLDRAPGINVDEIRRLVLRTPGVLEIESWRLRSAGASLFADLRVALDRTLPFERSHQIARDLEEQLSQHIPGLDVVVHADPAATPQEALDGGVLNFIRNRGLQAHHLTIYQRGDHLFADLHLEVSPDLTVRNAHDLASQLEDDIQAQFSEITSVQIHLEDAIPAGQPEILLSGSQPELHNQIAAICEDIVGANRCHSISLSRQAGMLSISMHCLFPDHLSISEAHRKTTQIEEELRRSIPDLDRVLIHAEPQG